MAKRNRIYRLTVGLQDEQGNPIDEALVITNPIGINFSVDRGIYSQRQSLEIDIFNLNKEHRRKLFRDRFQDKYLMCVLEAGYEDMGMAVIFAGFVWSCYSKREGTNTVTHITANTNLGEQYAVVNATLEKGQTIQDVVDACMKSVPYYTTGKQSIPDFTFIKPVSLADNAFRILRTYTGKRVYSDLMQVYVLDDDEAIEGYVEEITDSSGLLGTPERKDATLTVKTMFEPRLVVGQIIQIKSSVAEEFDGQYKIFGISHRGSINDAAGGKLETIIQMNIGSQVYGRFKIIK